MATNKAAKTDELARGVIARCGNDVEWFDELFERQDEDVQDRIIEIVNTSASELLAVIDEHEELTEYLMGLQVQVVRSRAREILVEQALAEDNVVDMEPEKEPVESHWWDQPDVLSKGVMPGGPEAGSDAELNELRDIMRSFGPLPTPVHITVTRGDATFKLDM